MNASEAEAYNALCGYTWSLQDREFIHQLVVDAYTAQHADQHTKPIAVTFALIGLYLVVEKRFTGRVVQRVHMQLARRKQTWPTFAPPTERGAMTAVHVMAVPAGPERADAIRAWCASVWAAYTGSRDQVIDLLRQHGIV